MTTQKPGRLIAQLVEHYDELIAMLSRRLGSAETAADVAQDLAVKLIGMPAPSNEAVRQPKHYLFRVARNLAVDRQRYDAVRDRGRQPLDVAVEQEDSGAPTPERILADREMLRQALVAIDDLPPRCRQVFVMRRLQDMDQDSIARALGISRNMVEKHLRTALVQIMRQLGRIE